MMRPTAALFAQVILCVFLFSCAQQPAAPNDHPVALSLTNAGTGPLRCRVMFGHWVDRDLGDLAPGAATTIAMTQSAADGALYVLRADGQRRMMIETVQCAQPGNWQQSVGQVDLATIRSGSAHSVEASCAAPAGGGRTACTLDRIN
ncbi:MAG TPA: hypothetical protein VGF43_09665 [Dongiaceae bacterium]|jgi:hypothetical protein